MCPVVQEEALGETKEKDLKPDGSKIPVTDENKKEYVQLVVEHKMSKTIRPQIDQFLKGFHEVTTPSIYSAHIILCRTRRDLSYT